MALQPNPKALQAVRYSHLALGKPYVFGGTNYKTGVDCSGLIYTAYVLGAHVTIPRTSETQWDAPSFRPVSLKDAIPGDLVFGNSGEFIAGKPGHVVLAIGDGKAICAQHTGTNVVIMKISEAFTTGSIMGVKRPLPAVGEGAYTGGQVIDSSGNPVSAGGDTSGGGDSSFLTKLTGGFDVLTDPHTYYRAGQVILGAIALLAGILMLAGSNKGIRDTAMDAAKVAAIA